jgi:hypothetical protein
MLGIVVRVGRDCVAWRPLDYYDFTLKLLEAYVDFDNLRPGGALR